MPSNSIEILMYYVLPMLILSIGMTGNLAFLLSGILVVFLSTCFQLTLYFVSDLACRLYFFCTFMSKLLSRKLLVYISLDRFISVKYYAKRFLLKKMKFQYLYVLFFVTFNFLYYIQTMEVGKNRQSHLHSSVDSRMRNQMNHAIFFAFINGMRRKEKNWNVIYIPVFFLYKLTQNEMANNTSECSLTLMAKIH